MKARRKHLGPHDTQTYPGKPGGLEGSRVDPVPDDVEVYIPSAIANLTYEPAGLTARAHESAVIAIARLEAGFGQHLTGFLLRSEAVLSSKIEHIDAGWTAFAKAVGGAPASDEARSQLAAVRALSALIEAADTGPITLAAVPEAHRFLMAPHYYAEGESGAMRTVQNWFGGSEYTPLDGVLVPPPPEEVSALMTDLLTFVNRTDLPIVAQAAIAHAQFRSIHPFTFGNGQIGWALIGAVLRHRGLTRRITVPLASVMLSDTTRYFDELTAYRRGDADSFVYHVATAATIASGAAEQSATALAQLPARWRAIATPRANSADEKLIDALLDTPILNAANALRITGTTEPSTYLALNRLTEAGILEVISASRRNRIWAARDILAELDALSAAVGQRVHSG